MLLLHDGATGGHTTWSEEAVRGRVADGVVISPFFTPESARVRHPSGADVGQRIHALSGSVIFDPTTHAVGLPGVDAWTMYRTWKLWSGPVGDLSTPTYVSDHVARCFDHASAVAATPVAPTVALDSPIGSGAATAIRLADEASAKDPSAWQAIAGRRGFWLSADLDSYIGSLAQLDAPVWVITVVRDQPEWPPDLSEVRVMEAVLRTVHSLSLRSRVVMAHSDLIGLPSIAAGADTIGTGWHTKQRVAAPAVYQTNDPTQIRRQAKWFTYEGLGALIHEQNSTVLTRADRARAERLYTGPVADGTGPRRLHHLGVVRQLVTMISGAGSSQDQRVAILRAFYEQAQSELDSLGATYSRAFVQQRIAYVDGVYAALQAYATAEGIW